jgi:hypothetical protein
MRKLLIAAFAVPALLFAACSASTDEVLLVTELTDGEQISLCEAVLADCVDPICADPCIDTGCAAAVDMGAIDVECAGVFEDELAVDDCVLDALDSICP